MGWFGYGTYDGDGTRSTLFSFLEYAGLNATVVDSYMDGRGMCVSKEHQKLILTKLPKIIKKLPKFPIRDEDDAVTWQMLGAFFIDNKLPIPATLRTKVCSAVTRLYGEHASEFNQPYKRRRSLDNFSKNLNSLKTTRKYFP